jgi:hypothetical protein
VPAARRPRVYVHVGEPKTGTTFLQNVLWENRPRLAARGILLPGYTRRDHTRASRDLRQAPREAFDPAEPWLGDWDVLVGQALRAPDAAVISDEILAACNPPQADRAVRSLLAAEVHVVLTVRDFASRLTAEWQERVKCRGTDPWEEWLASVVDAAPAPDRRRRSWFWAAHDTLAILGMWSQHLPADHVHVITVPSQGQAAELWLRFAAVLGIDPSGIDLTNARTNPSLGLDEAEFLRRMNEALPETMPDWFYTRHIKRTLAHNILAARPGQTRLVLPPGREAWALEQADILVAGLGDAKYDIVGDLGDLIPRPAAGRYVAPSDQPAEKLLDAAVHAAAAMADTHYRQMFPVRQQRPRLGPRQRISKLKWAVLNGPRTKRVLRSASHRPAVRRLRVTVWCVLIHPARHRRSSGPATLS